MIGLKHTQILTTGGTISSVPQDNGDVSAALSGEELINELGVTGNIKVDSSVTIGSFAFENSTLLTVANDVLNALKQENVSGVVVTHGTDTMEETAFYLSLVVDSPEKPIILTGAQLDASYSYSDGTRNLQDAIYAAQSEELSGMGVLVVFSGFVHTSRDVRKVDTNALQAFDSPGWGPVARVDNENVILARKVNLFPKLDPVIPSSVVLIRSWIGMTDKEFRQMTEGFSGVVIEAFGRGNAHPTISDEVRRLINLKIPVIITSRCLSGSVLPVYGNGGGKDLERAGAWFSGDLSGEKARILLGTMLANKKSWKEMQEILETINYS